MRLTPKKLEQVIITGGVASPKNPNVMPNGYVQFINQDDHAYRIRLWGEQDKEHPVVDILLPAYGGITVMGDPDCTDGHCAFELANAKYKLHGRKRHRPHAGPGGKIIVGSGP